MTTIEETINTIQALIQQLGQSSSTAAAAVKSAEAGRNRAAALGTQTSFQQLAHLHDGLATIQVQIGQLGGRAKQLMALAHTIHGR